MLNTFKILLFFPLVILFSCNKPVNYNIEYNDTVTIYGDAISTAKSDTFLKKWLEIDSLNLNFMGDYTNDTFDIFINNKFTKRFIANTKVCPAIISGTYKIKSTGNILIKDISEDKKYDIDYKEGYVNMEIWGKKKGEELFFIFNNEYGNIY